MKRKQLLLSATDIETILYEIVGDPNKKIEETICLLSFAKTLGDMSYLFYIVRQLNSVRKKTIFSELNQGATDAKEKFSLTIIAPPSSIFLIDTSYCYSELFNGTVLDKFVRISSTPRENESLKRFIPSSFIKLFLEDQDAEMLS